MSLKSRKSLKYWKFLKYRKSWSLEKSLKGFRRRKCFSRGLGLNWFSVLFTPTFLWITVLNKFYEFWIQRRKTWMYKFKPLKFILFRYCTNQNNEINNFSMKMESIHELYVRLTWPWDLSYPFPSLNLKVYRLPQNWYFA